MLQAVVHVSRSPWKQPGVRWHTVMAWNEDRRNTRKSGRGPSVPSQAWLPAVTVKQILAVEQECKTLAWVLCRAGVELCRKVQLWLAVCLSFALLCLNGASGTGGLPMLIGHFGRTQDLGP